MPDTSPGTEDAAMNKTGEIPAPWSLQCSKESVFLSGLSLCLRNRSLCPCSREADCSRIAQALRKLCLPPVPSRAGAAAAGSVTSASPYPAASLLLKARLRGTRRHFSFLTSASKGVQGNWEAWWIKALWKWIIAQHGERGDVLKGQTVPRPPCFSPPEVNWRSYSPQGVKLTRCWEFSKSAKKKKVTTALKSDRLVGGFVDRLVVLGIRC